MRTGGFLPAALIVLASCSGTHVASSTSPQPSGSPSPLRPCEVRELTLDGAKLVVQANLDATPAAIVVVNAPSDDVRAKAFQDAVKIFGVPRPDERTQVRQFKWGLTQLTDMCGRPVIGSPLPSPSPN